MTNEELIDFIKSSKGHWTFKTENGKEVSEEQIVKALEQQPSEDCISREQAIRATYGFERYTGIDETPYEYVESILRDLPSVTPKAESNKMCNMTCKEMNEWAKTFMDGFIKGIEDEEE